MNLYVKDAAKLLSVSEKTIYRWIKQGDIPFYRVQGSYRFSRAELLTWVGDQRRGVSGDAHNEPENADEPLPSLVEAIEAGGIVYRIAGGSREQVIEDVVTHLRLPEETDREALTSMLITREQLSPTGIGEGIALPHPRSPGLVHVQHPTVTICFLEQASDFGALDGQPVSVLLVVIAPNLRSHLHLLSRIGFVLHAEEFVSTLHNEESRDKIFAALAEAEANIHNRRGATKRTASSN